jgi:hypothetical protein
MRSTQNPADISTPQQFTPVQHGSADQGYISTSVLSGFPELVRKLGGDPAALLARIGMTEAQCEPPYGQLLFKDFAGLLEETVDATGCHDVGLRLSELQSGLYLLGPVGATLEHAETVGDVFENCSRHMYVYSSAIHTHLERYSDSDEVLCVYECLADGVAHRRQVMEQLLSVHADDTIRYSGGAARVKEIWFAHEPLAPPSVYQKRFGCKVRFW